MLLAVFLAMSLCPQEVYPLDVWMPTPVLVDAGPNTLQWSVVLTAPQDAQVEYSADDISWTVIDLISWGADEDIFFGGYYRVIGLLNGFPITEYSNVLQL